jgi:peptide chain release factor 1
MIGGLVIQILGRFSELESELSDPAVIGDRERYATTRRAYSELETGARLAEQYRLAMDDADGARELLAEGGEDPELRSLMDTSRVSMR